VTVYADASAVLNLYLDEPDSEVARGILSDDPTWISSCVTTIEVRRNLRRLLDDELFEEARAVFELDWSETLSLELDDAAAARAAALAERTGAKSLDAIHLEGALRAGAAEGVPIITFDRGLAAAVRSLGWRVLPE
jgi:predicted nucleic acid-binding protein